MAVMTTEALQKLVRTGFGTGRGELYQPWIRIRRKLTSKISKLYARHVPMHHRLLHLLSGLEDDAAHVGAWLQAIEAREQFPMWPDEHLHPDESFSSPYGGLTSRVEGLMSIAKRVGIDHGYYVGTKIPFVATMDFMWGLPQLDTPKLVAWSCKPKDQIDDENRVRMRERMQLEYLYCEQCSIPYRVIDGSHWTQLVADQLRWLQPVRSQLKQLRRGSRLGDFGARFMELCEDRSITEASNKVAVEMGLELDEKNRMFQAAVWTGHINADLRFPIVMSHRLIIDRGYKQSLRTQLMP
ncbi:MAG: hypothetical protein DI587_24720 [Variovorax paradoxus]|nr:MAG: hypothetical protein DI583_24720 [Variovorax paradoxus]PZQ05420.1 MAG: hypothetical protein DI587_24720 [Variovorax paradoxus]